MMKKHEDFKNLVYIFMKNNPNKRKSEVADRFMVIGIKSELLYIVGSSSQNKKKASKEKKVVVDLLKQLQELTYFE